MADYRWLNEYSQQFLERDYLLPGQTVDERVDIICQKAEEILEMEGFAARFKENFQKGWYSLSTPVWTNFGTDRGLPISCVTGDTWINTKSHSGKQARDIQIGDEVLTHKGRYRKVTNVIVTPKKDKIYKLKVFNSMTNLYLTGDHLVLTNMGWVRTDELDLRQHFVAINRKIDLEENEYIIDFTPIREISLTEKEEEVFDFTVDEDHSFSASGVILHNCFGSHINDDMESILHTHAEVGMMCKGGGGTSAYFGDLRGRGEPIRNNGDSFGSVHFMQLFDKLINVVSQGSTRRGNFAAYLPIDHKDIHEFLTIRKEGSPLQDILSGVTVTDTWMQSMIDGDTDKRQVWAKLLEARTNTGFPYIFFTDTVNNNTVDVYKDKGMRITHSNMCSEILLPDNEYESFVCDLSSMNILYYDEWKDTDAVELMTFLLDAVMTDFIEKARNIPFMEKSVRFAERHRALGIGWLGWHSYLQSKMISFESMEAKLENSKIAENIKSRAWQASAKLAEKFGEPELLKGYGRRNTTLTAIAPTKSSAFIIGQVSEGIEPHRANYYIKDLQKGKYTIKNSHLEELLESKGNNTKEVWDSILKNSGSVQHLNFLSDHEKEVFKTFIEISPKEVIIQAAQRQKFIDQGQSVNLVIDPKVPIREVNALVIDAWKLGVKTLYYNISVNAAQQLTRSILTCQSCEG